MHCTVKSFQFLKPTYFFCILKSIIQCLFTYILLQNALSLVTWLLNPSGHGRKRTFNVCHASLFELKSKSDKIVFIQTGKHPGQLKDDVTSPGGTTIRGLQVMERGGIRGIMMDAVQASAERTTELGAK